MKSDLEWRKHLSKQAVEDAFMTSIKEIYSAFLNELRGCGDVEEAYILARHNCHNQLRMICATYDAMQNMINEVHSVDPESGKPE